MRKIEALTGRGPGAAAGSGWGQPAAAAAPAGLALGRTGMMGARR
jgi:hypothetical protein